MVTAPLVPSIDEYLRKRLMPVEGAIPQLAGIEMFGNSIPAEKVGGDLIEYINFQQRYNIGARIAREIRARPRIRAVGQHVADFAARIAEAAQNDLRLREIFFASVVADRHHALHVSGGRRLQNA